MTLAMKMAEERAKSADHQCNLDGYYIDEDGHGRLCCSICGQDMGDPWGC